MRFTFFIGFIIWYFNVVVYVSTNNHKALIFNREKNSLIAIPDNYNLDSKCDTWVTVCPAESGDEQDFEKKFSFYNAALFVKNMVDEKNSCEDLRHDVCDEPYKLSMAWFRETVEFGYEIYFEKSEKFKPSHYESLESTKYIMGLESLSWSEFFQHLTKSRETTKEEVILQLDETKPIMEFVWISLFKVWFQMKWVRKVEYDIRKNNVDPMLPCQGYTLGEELFHQANIDWLYSEKNQENVFRGLQLPQKSEKNGCKTEFNCLEKWSLIPTDQFQFGSSSPLVCSNIVTVPIWRSTIKRILEKVDRYLYALSRISGEPLRIVAGVNGVLQLPRRGLGLLTLLNNYVYLKHPKLTIRAPNRIYKIVKYQAQNCDVSVSLRCWYGVLIVIENNPFFEEKNRICEDESERLGWAEIKYETLSSDDGATPSKFIYVCKISSNSLYGVGLTPSTFEGDIFVEEYSLVDVSDKVLEELERLSEHEQNTESELVLESEINEIIERPAIYDEDFDLIINRDDETLNDDYHIYYSSDSKEKHPEED